MSTVNGFQVGSETLKYNYESLDNYNTPNFSTSSSTTYAVGDYVMYNGKLYKCTTATTGGTWVSSSWTEAVLSDDVSDLNRQISDFKESVFDSEYYLSLTKSSEDFTVEEGYYATRYGKNPLAGYNLYYFVAAKDFDFYCSDYTLQYGQALIIAIYNNGVISSENYVRDYKRSDNNLPTSENKASVSEGQVFAVSLYTPASSPEKFEIFANYKNVLLNGDIVLAQSQVDQVVDSFINVSAPFILVSKSASNDFTVEDGYYAGSYGKQPLSGYKLYSITAEKDFEFYFNPANTIPANGALIAGIYNGEITQTAFVRQYRLSDANLPTENNKASINKGQILAISIYTPSGDPKDFRLYANYKYVDTLPEKIEVVTAIKNFALHKKCAWFGDSISQLKQLPHTTGNLLHMDVYDCSVKGSCIGRTYSNFNSFSFSNLVTAVIAHDFTQQYAELEAQEQATGQDLRDIRENLNTLASITVDDWKNNIDYVVLLQGTNDFAIPISAAAGYESRLAETKALMESAISRLLVFAPQLQFYIFTPFYRGDDITADVDGRPLTDYVSMEQDVAAEYAIPCCNLMTSSRICADTEVIYLNQTDHVHPTDYGDNYLADICAKFISIH